MTGFPSRPFKRRYAGPPSSPKNAWPSALVARLRSLPRDEDGTIAQITLLAMLGCVLAIGLVGNLARMTQEKIDVQNGADATAHAVATWHARGLNAITATNHLMGEITALCVLHEALGGPELDSGEKVFTDELKWADLAISEPPTDMIQFQDAPFDRPLIEFIKDQCADGGNTTAGAALYDARYTLKRWIAQAFGAKMFANVLIKVKVLPPVYAAGVLLHFAATAVLAKCTVEWMILDNAVEPIARGLIKPKNILQDQVLPLLSKYQTLIAKDNPTARSGWMETSIESTATQLSGINGVRATLHRERLPIQIETPPSGGSGGPIPSRSIATEDLPPVRLFVEAHESLRSVAKAFNRVAEFLGMDRVGIAALLEPPIAEPDVYRHNPTVDKYQAHAADWSIEHTTQWTRATYPWMHSGRARMLGLFNRPEALTFSRMPTFYGHWTTRLALVKSYEFRSGDRMDGQSQSPMAMHVLKGSSADTKGREDWTRRDGSRTAERYFTNLGFAERDVNPLFSPTVFGASRHTQFGVSQAIVYNANTGKHLGDSQHQPIVGWDTLNWRPNSNIPEYGVRPSVDKSGHFGDFLAVLFGRRFSSPPPVKLNWQAKLVPVTESRLRDSLGSNRLDTDLRQSMEKMTRTMRKLNTH